jgi:hypothetical protein
MIPVDVADDDIGDVACSEPGSLDPRGWLLIIRRTPLADGLLAVKAGIEQDIATAALDEPHHHCDIHFAVAIRARDEARHAKIFEGGVF